jgi:hypothetical protein
MQPMQTPITGAKICVIYRRLRRRWRNFVPHSTTETCNENET